MKASILNDLTKCIGCEACVQACRESNGLPANARRDRLSAESWTVVDRSHGHPVRRQCMHCLEPACASACPVAALSKSKDGPVVYDSSKCIGCRYCMVACPFSIPTYQWESRTPIVQKCILCYEDKVSKGEPPACTSVCPTGATTFGERDRLVEVAKSRIAASPSRYVDHIYGLEEAGGTSVLYLSGIPFSDLGFPPGVQSTSYPQLTWRVLDHLPDVVGLSAVVLGSLAWIIHRRDKVSMIEGHHESASGLREERS